MVQEAGPLTPQTQQVVSQASSPISTNQKEVLVETQSTPAAQSAGTAQSVAATERIVAAAPQVVTTTGTAGVVTRELVRTGDPTSTNHGEPIQSVAGQPEAVSSASSSVRALYAQSASQSAIETEPVAEVVEERRVASASPLAHATVTPLPVRAMPGTKADYGWLAQELWNRVERTKRYPRLARVHGWEGKVVVRAVIKADGSLLQEDVEESSGHEALDQDALDLMKQVCPLALKHPLGQPQVIVHVPIHYRIEQ